MKKTVFFLMISFVMFLRAQNDNNQIHETLTTINNSETQIHNKIDKEVNSLSKDILSNKEHIITNENKIEDLTITRVTAQALLIGILFSLGLGYLFQNYIKHRMNKNVVAVETELKNSMDRVREAEIRTIHHIKNAEIENDEIRKKSQILLVSETSTPINEDLQRIFVKGSSKVQFNCEQIKIKELSYKSIQKALLNEKKPHPVDFELIIFDNSNAQGRKWNQKDIDDYMIPLTKDLTSKGIGVLYYSNDQYYPSRNSEYINIPNKHLLTYANVYPHVYHNAMTVLKIQNLYKE